MVRRVRAGLVLAVLSLTVLEVGCGQSPTSASPETRKENVTNHAFEELANLLEIRQGDNPGKPFEKAAELSKYAKGFPMGTSKVKTGEIVFLFGAPVQAGASDKILAYEKQTPESGGVVLMQDGTTIKKMTAEEFKAAPKAPGKASVETSSKKS